MRFLRPTASRCMPFMRAELDRLAERYGLGDVVAESPIEGGMVNECHCVRTEHGDFVFKRLGYDANSHQLGRRMYEKLELEFRVLEYLEGTGSRTRFPCLWKTGTATVSPGSTTTT